MAGFRDERDGEVLGEPLAGHPAAECLVEFGPGDAAGFHEQHQGCGRVFLFEVDTPAGGGVDAVPAVFEVSHADDIVHVLGMDGDVDGSHG